MTDLAIIILTGNEQLHIGRCLEKCRRLEPKEIFVIDSCSTDGTQKIVEAFRQAAPTELTVGVYEHAWPGLYAPQFNWGLDNCPITAEWCLRLDADEYLFDETMDEVKALLPTLDRDVTGLSLARQVTFLQRPVRHGCGKIWLTRFFRTGVGRCEERMMDEHIALSRGRTLMLKGEFIDDNLNGIAWWTQKHLGYSIRQAIDYLDIEYGFLKTGGAEIGGQAAGKRAMKLKYARLPLFFRCFVYFLYRYFLKGGFLDGRTGFLWNFFQGWWNQTLVDYRILEIKRAAFSGRYDAYATSGEKVRVCLVEEFDCGRMLEAY